MRLTLIAVGRLKSGPDRELCNRYWDRLTKQGRSLGLTNIQIIELGEARSESAEQRKADEAKAILGKITSGARIVALDETGKQQSSSQFATFLRTAQENAVPDLCFVIGGPDGHGDAMLQAAETTLSLGRFTLPHGLARIVLAEQLYRATTIIAGHPYHRE